MNTFECCECGKVRDVREKTSLSDRNTKKPLCDKCFDDMQVWDPSEPNKTFRLGDMGTKI